MEKNSARKREAQVDGSLTAPFAFFLRNGMSFLVMSYTPSTDRREPRDVVDLVTIHQNILPLGAVVCAAVGRFPGQSPEEMLSDIIRHSRFDAEEFRVLATQHPVDVPGLHRRIRSMIEDAERFISQIPSDAVGFVFLEAGKPVQPDPEALGRYQRHAGVSGGVWPSSPEIVSAMFERYKQVIHPARNASIGSIDEAHRPGRNAATIAVNTNTPVATNDTCASKGGVS
jgi:hypothetical protein